MVRRLRSVRQVHFEGSLRKERMLDSSVGVMKFEMRVRPGIFVVWVWRGGEGFGAGWRRGEGVGS